MIDHPHPHLFDLFADVLVDPVGGSDVGATAVAVGNGGGGAAGVEAIKHHVHRRPDELHVDDCAGKRFRHETFTGQG